jgi:GntR family transcriptional regulator / MocR family aminotransferase
MAHKVVLNLNVFSGTPLYLQVANELRAAIQNGILKRGERLPSIRELSKQLQISVITTREAIERLCEEGLVESRQGSGNFVSSHAVIENAQPLDQENFEPVRFTQSSYESAYHELDKNFPWSQEAREINKAFNESAFHPWWDLVVDYEFRVYQPVQHPIEGLHFQRALQGWTKLTELASDGMNDPRGSYPLRHELARWLNKTRQLACSPEDVFITCGAQQARDLVAKLLINPGDEVVVEEPGSITDMLAYSTKGAHLLHVPQEQDGISIEELKRHKTAVAAHIISATNFPTGITMSVPKRRALLEWAEAHDVVIVEDSYGGGFHHSAPIAPSLYQLGQEMIEQPTIIYVGSLSHFVNPALRLGYVILPKKLHSSWTLTKWLADRHTSSLAQQVALKMLIDGHFEEDALRIAQSARSRRAALHYALQKWPVDLATFSPVESGFHQAVWFKGQIDDLLVFERALASRIGVIPLSPYFKKFESRSGLCLSFMQMREDKIVEGMNELLEIVNKVRTCA